MKEADLKLRGNEVSDLSQGPAFIFARTISVTTPLGFYNQAPGIVWFINNCFSHFWVWKSIMVPVCSGSGGNPVPGLQMAAFSLCPHVVERRQLWSLQSHVRMLVPFVSTAPRPPIQSHGG